MPESNAAGERPPSLFLRRPNLEDLPPLPDLPPGCTLRRALLTDGGDLSPLAALLAKAFHDESWTREKTRQVLAADSTVRETWVIEVAGRIVATASARLLPDRYPGSGYVHWVAADPDLAGRGLGRAATLATLYAFARMGCRDAVLETDDFRLPAISTYRKLGFVPKMRHPSHPGRWANVEAELGQRPAPS